MAITVLYDFCLMSALFVVSKIIRAKVRFIQRLYIPTALIAGFVGGHGTAAGIVLIAIAAACLVICKTVFGKNRNTESV